MLLNCSIGFKNCYILIDYLNPGTKVVFSILPSVFDENFDAEIPNAETDLNILFMALRLFWSREYTWQ